MSEPTMMQREYMRSIEKYNRICREWPDEASGSFAILMYSASVLAEIEALPTPDTQGCQKTPLQRRPDMTTVTATAATHTVELDIDDIDDETLRALRVEAGEAGDTETIEACTRALEGDEGALDVCLEILNAARVAAASWAEETRQGAESVACTHCGREIGLTAGVERATYVDGAPYCGDCIDVAS